MDFSLSPRAKELRDQTKQFIAEQVTPLENDPRQDSHGPHPELRAELVSRARAAGLLTPHASTELGGLGLTHVEKAVVFEEAGYSWLGPTAMNIHAPDEGNIHLMEEVATPAQKSRWLSPQVQGHTRSCFCMTEPSPGAGADPSMLNTTAVRDGDHYVIHGQKIWTSRALFSDLMLLLVRTTPIEQVKRKTEGLSVFLVDMREAIGKGMTIRPIKAMINHNTTEVFYDGLRVPAENLIGEEGKGFRYILDGMNAERILVSHESIGDAKWFIRTAAKYANERIVFDRPIGMNQGIQFPIAKAYAASQAAELMLRKAAAMFEAGQACGEEANLSKLLSAEAAWEAGEACVQTHGGFAYAREYDVERKWREARVQRTAPVSTNLILAYLAEHVIGLPRSY